MISKKNVWVSGVIVEIIGTNCLAEQNANDVEGSGNHRRFVAKSPLYLSKT